jgi:hypothetical protein
LACEFQERLFALFRAKTSWFGRWIFPFDLHPTKADLREHRVLLADRGEVVEIVITAAAVDECLDHRRHFKSAAGTAGRDILAVSLMLQPCGSFGLKVFRLGDWAFVPDVPPPTGGI